MAGTTVRQMKIEFCADHSLWWVLMWVVLGNGVFYMVFQRHFDLCNVGLTILLLNLLYPSPPPSLQLQWVRNVGFYWKWSNERRSHFLSENVVLGLVIREKMVGNYKVSFELGVLCKDDAWMSITEDYPLPLRQLQRIQHHFHADDIGSDEVIISMVKEVQCESPLGPSGR